MIKVSQLKRRRARAILAGGMVLGLGAAVTMAAWSDSEFASSIFSTGSFNLQGSLDGTTFQDHDSAGGQANLTFAMNPDDLTPDDTVAAPFAVQLEQGTTYDAEVRMESATLSGDLSGLTYQVLQTTAFECTPATTGTTLVPVNTAFGSGPSAVLFTIDSPEAGVDEQVNLCFKVTAGADLTQGASSTATWQLTAASTS